MNANQPSDEFGLIAWIRERTQRHGRTIRGIGDDCAQLRPTAGADYLVTTDMLMDGRHFLLESAGAEAVGYKALGVNLSDIAAMAGIPVAAVTSVALPRAQAVEIAQGLHRGMVKLAEHFGVELVGGDTNAWDGPLVISVTLLGETTPKGAVLRSGALPGDVIFVTGPLGGSLAGRHLRPEPRVAEALALQQAVPLHAMVDISDGLAADLGHILEESEAVGAILDADGIPIHPDAITESQRDGRSPLEHALHDGEDFELCFTVSPESAERLLTSPPHGVKLHRIGQITHEPGLRLRQSDGQCVPLEPRGFNHLRRSSRDSLFRSAMKIDRSSNHVTLEVNSPQETERVGQALAKLAKPGTVIGLVGTLGAGKTRLVRAMAEALEVDPGAIASPTFVLIHEYEGVIPIYHFDTYRLASADEFDALGASDYFNGDGVCLIEWADLVADRLPLETWFVNLESTGPESRRIHLQLPDPEAFLKHLDVPVSNEPA